MSREYTKEELRKKFLDHIRNVTRYWASNHINPDATIQDRCDGVAFSILSTLDGSSLVLPSFDIVARPHTEDMDYCIEEGENWIQDGQIINDDRLLHDLFYKKEIK